MPDDLESTLRKIGFLDEADEAPKPDAVDVALAEAGLEHPAPALAARVDPEPPPPLKRFAVTVRHTPLAGLQRGLLSRAVKTPIVEAYDEAGARAVIAGQLGLTDPKLISALDLTITEVTT